MWDKVYHFQPSDAATCSGIVAVRTGRTRTRVRNVTMWRIPVNIDGKETFITDLTAQHWHAARDCEQKG